MSKENIKYYHITDKKNLSTILREGLKANDEGDIFLFENKSVVVNSVVNTVADCIAHNQVFLSEYVMLEIANEGIKSELINDNAGEITSPLQWIVKQPLIEAIYLNFYEFYVTEFKPFYSFYN